MTDTTQTPDIVGAGAYRYQPLCNWAKIPDDIDFVEAIGVTVGSNDRVYVFNRGETAVLVFEPNGEFVESWGEGEFVRPHGITAAGDSNLYLTDDLGHRVSRFSVAGSHIRNIGPFGVPSESGVDGFDYRKIANGVGPYNLPTNVAVAADGHLFVADGYGNARIHEFDPQGELVHSWGGPGDDEGQFNVPHGICIDSQGKVLVADRENSRIQHFDRNGAFLGQWSDVVRPCQVFAWDGVVFVAELGNLNGRFPWQTRPETPIGGRVSVFSEAGDLLSRWGGGHDARRPDGFYACHDICVDSRGDVYVGEVAVTAAKAAGEDPTGLPTLRKFSRVLTK
jgi:DNA-binding beta-propeller fold protein YncE